MRYSFWPDGSMPVYINPTAAELKELAEQRPDTLRLCEDDDIIAIASGYGNTHESVVRAVREVLKLKRWHPLDYILYQSNGEWAYNPLGHFDGINSEKVSVKQGKDFVSQQMELAIDQFLDWWRQT